MIDAPQSWFNSPERIALLEFKAGKWIGTPFAGNSCECGPRGGVSCQKLASAIYRECRFAAIDVPEVPIAFGIFSQGGAGKGEQNLLEPFVDGLRNFERLALGRHELQAGDLIAMRIKRAPHHVGVMLPGRNFIHAMNHVGTIVSSLTDATYGSRLVAAWRPVLQGAPEGVGI